MYVCIYVCMYACIYKIMKTICPPSYHHNTTIELYLLMHLGTGYGFCFHDLYGLSFYDFMIYIFMIYMKSSSK